MRDLGSSIRSSTAVYNMKTGAANDKEYFEPLITLGQFWRIVWRFFFSLTLHTQCLHTLHATCFGTAALHEHPGVIGTVEAEETKLLICKNKSVKLK